jgi:hypothetical protein
MSPESRRDLIDKILEFVANAKRTLLEFQRVTGHMSWSLNVFPRLRPALACLYDKISGKDQRHQHLHLNKRIRQDLEWFVWQVNLSDGQMVSLSPAPLSSTRVLRSLFTFGWRDTLGLQGVPEEHIRRLGRWASDAFNLYIRKHPILLYSMATGRSLFQNPLTR